MNLTILGNCATQTLEHETTSFLLDTGEKKILIDCGPSTVRQLQKAGVSPLDISAIIITHCHADHTAGYPYLLFTINLARMMSGTEVSDKISVIALKSVYNGIAETLNTQYPVEQLGEKLVEPYIVEDKTNTSFFIDKCKIELFSTYHTVPSIGARIENKETSITFSGDTLFHHEIAQHAKNSNVLVHEAFCTENSADMARNSGHSTAREAGIIAREAGVEKLVLCHPLAVMWNDENNLIGDARREFAGKVLLPREFENIML
ncbi:MAG: MBL fold metallo-hydrolase [Eubacterium sp.]|jgi:ribonuclease Z|nr:MBL fold metallo-hydrolase [Eubacterium sp.]